MEGFPTLKETLVNWIEYLSGEQALPFLSGMGLWELVDLYENMAPAFHQKEVM